MLVFIFLLLTLHVVSANDIFSAVANDDASEIRKLLAEHPSMLNSKGPGGQTPLMNAVLSGKVISVEALLSHKADVTIPEKDGYVPIHGAGFQGRAEIAQLLIDNGVSVLSPHSDGYLPFHRACWGTEERHTETVRVFLEAGGMDYAHKASNGQTCWKMTKNAGTKKLLKEYKEKKNKSSSSSSSSSEEL